MVAIIISIIFHSFVSTSAVPLPWTYRGYESFPTLWFGATEHGGSSILTLESASRFQIVGWGWNHNNSGAPIEEEILLRQSMSFNQFLQENNKTKPDSVFVYRTGFAAITSYKTSVYPHDYIHDPKYDEFWIRDRQGKKCWLNLTPVYKGPLFNFSSPGARRFFMENLVGQIVQEATQFKGAYNSIFFDDIDNSWCVDKLPNTNCSLVLSFGEKRQLVMDTITIFVETTKVLNQVGIIPVISYRTLLRKYMDKLGWPCPVEEEVWIEALQGTQWIRYYEEFPAWNDPWKDPYCALNMIDTTLKYGTRAVPSMQVHSYDVNEHSGLNSFILAAFYMGQDDFSYFFATNGWYDQNNFWWPAYDRSCGKPLGMPRETTPGIWMRNFTKCRVWMDVPKFVGNVTYI